jgi:HD superfamily phosphohydrolase
MLSTFRSKHMKKVLWILAGIIIVAFGLGGSSFLRGAKKNIVGTIDNKPITDTDFANYLRIAQIYALLNLPPDTKITYQDLERLALEFVLTLWKADQEKVTVSDSEVIEFIKQRFSLEGKFDKAFYKDILRHISQRYNLSLTEKSFEECIRLLIQSDKLLKKYIKVEASDEEAEELYRLENTTDENSGFNSKDFQEKKDIYLYLAKRNKELSEKTKLLNQIQEEANLILNK